MRSLPPEFSRGDADLSVLIRKSVIAIAREEEWSVKIDIIDLARENARGSQP